MNVELVACTQPRIEGVSPDTFTAYIARIGRVKDNPERLIRYLIQHAHWSPFEHTFLTFKLVTSRAMGRELLRHRSFTFQELSLRYEKAPATEAIELRMQSVRNRQSSTTPFDPLLTDPHNGSLKLASELIQEQLQNIQNLYTQLLDAGVARECARFILPECTRTTILMSGSLRSWIHFFAVRDHPDAQKEIQLLSKEIKRIFCQEFEQIAAEAFTVTPEPTATISTGATEQSQTSQTTP